MGKSIEPAADRPRNYQCVQALRAVAASLVVVHHSISTWMAWVLHQTGTPRWPNGAAGVDIFFVISGFVMAISLPGLAGKPNKAGVFLWRRFTRIVPLYWAALTLTVVEIKLSPGSPLDLALTPWRVIASYLFIPAKNGAGQMFPIATVGWTLNFEVFFYLLFAVALALDVAPLAFLTPCLTALALVGMLRGPGWPDFTSLASPVVLEFLFGVVLAHLVVRRKLPRNTWAALLLGGGFLALLLVPEPRWPTGFLVRGLPAAAIVAGAVGLEDAWGRALPRWLLRAGGASYALYLSHTFLLPLVGGIIARMPVPAPVSLAAAIALALGIGFPVAVLVHRYVESPLMNWFKKGRAEKFEIRNPKFEGAEPIIVVEPVADV